LLPLNAVDRVKKIKKAIRGKKSYQGYSEHKIMETYSIGYNELMKFPYEKYLELSKIISLENKEEKKKAEREQKKAKQ